MAKKIIRLTGKQQRAYAHAQIDKAPDGYVVTIAEPTRNLDQNARLWAMLTDVAKAQPMGWKYTPEDWKAIMMRACGWEVAFLPGLSGDFFPVGFRSSQMSVRQMAELLTFIRAWGDEHHIPWSEPEPKGYAA